MKVVSPYRPFAPESREHVALGPFDWETAIEHMASSVEVSCACPTFAITDVDTTLRVPAYHYETHERRLMLWILEVSKAYLASDDFDQDTVMVSPDLLVFDDLRRFFVADLGVLIRWDRKHQDRPLLNGVQFWRHRAKDRLVAFFDKALAIARELPPSTIAWGADTVPILKLIEPLYNRTSMREGLLVELIDACSVMRSVSATEIASLEQGHGVRWPGHTVVDFKLNRKHSMAAYYHATIGAGVPS